MNTSDSLYLTSIVKTIDDTCDYVFPKVEELLDTNIAMGHDDDLSIKLLDSKDEINRIALDLLQEDHLEYFKYVKDKNKIRVYMNLENGNCEIDCRYISLELLKKIYQIQENGDIFRKVSNDGYPDYDYSLESWNSKENYLITLGNTAKRALSDSADAAPKKKIHTL